MPRPTITNTLFDLATFRPRKPLRPHSVRGCPDGDGGAVLVLPGLLHGDAQTRRFRDCLQMLGYTPHGWGLGINGGPTPRTMAGLSESITTLSRRHGALRIVGFSMGGLLARWAAQSRPHLVRQVITICAPFRDPLDSAWLPIRPLLPLWRELDARALAFMVRQTPSRPWAALYSRRDGLIAWQSCMDPAHPDRCFEMGVRHRIAMREEDVFRQVARLLPDAA